MPERVLAANQHTAEAEPEQDGKASVVMQAKMDAELRREISDALVLFGFETLADGIRLVLKAFSRSPAVRDAVRDALHLAVLDVPKAEGEPTR